MQAERISKWVIHECEAVDALKEFVDAVQRTFSLLRIKEKHPSAFDDMNKKLNEYIKVQKCCIKELEPIFVALRDVEGTITSIQQK